MRSSLIAVMTFITSVASGAQLAGVYRVQRAGVDTKYAVQAITDLIRSEKVSQYSLSSEDMEREPDQILDLNVDDELIRALKDIERRSLERIAQTVTLVSLLEKDSWSLEDRLQWERVFVKIVWEERNATPGLGTYRSVENRNSRAESRAIKVNDLASDIRDNTDRIEFDCELMSTIDGLLLQRLEDTLLPADGSSFKKVSTYTRATGYIYMEFATFNGVKDSDKHVSGDHVFLISSATGSIIEATASPAEKEIAYREPLQAWQGIDGYLRGEGVLVRTENKLVLYTTFADDKEAERLVVAAKQSSYADSIPVVAAKATGEVNKLKELLSQYVKSSVVQHLTDMVTAGVWTEARLKEVRDIFRQDDIRDIKSQIAEQMRVLRFHMSNLKHVVDRLHVGTAKTKATEELERLTIEATTALQSVTFDIQATTLSSDAKTVVYEKLSGKIRRNMSAQGYDDIEKLPLVYPVTALDDLDVKLL